MEGCPNLTSVLTEPSASAHALEVVKRAMAPLSAIFFCFYSYVLYIIVSNLKELKNTSYYMITFTIGVFDLILLVKLAVIDTTGYMGNKDDLHKMNSLQLIIFKTSESGFGSHGSCGMRSFSPQLF